MEFCSTQKEGPLLIVTINRPNALNSLHTPASLELEQVFNEFAADPTLYVAIITGAGEKAFCAGNDLKYVAEGGLADPVTGFGGLTKRYDNYKPIIAAVNGFAFGGGFEIALACDLVIAAETARFALPEAKVGLAAMAGGMHRLPRQIPLKQAMGIILTGRHVSAQEGKDLGFVNEVVPQNALLETARKWANLILEGAPLSIQASKQTVMGGLDSGPLPLAIDSINSGLQRMLASEDFIEGPLAFAQKRKPQWKGR